MRWKWLLVLSLIAISVTIVSGNDDGTDETLLEENDPSYDDEEQTDDTPVVDELPDTGSEDDAAAADSSKDTDPAESVNEDTVDVENVAIGEQKGKYSAYDDYFLSSALDGSDSGYDWNSESYYFRTIYSSSYHCQRKARNHLGSKFGLTNTANGVILSQNKNLTCEID